MKKYITEEKNKIKILNNPNIFKGDFIQKKKVISFEEI